MSYEVDFSLADSQQIETALCARVKQIRLANNLSQLQLAKDAGLSRATIERLESGSGVSLETFIRVLVALHIQGGLEAALPDLSVRPIERVRLSGRQRQRAFPKKRSPGKGKKWTWGEEGSH